MALPKNFKALESFHELWTITDDSYPKLPRLLCLWTNFWQKRNRTLGLKKARNALTLYETIWSLSPCWDSMILTYRHKSKLTAQDLVLGQSCPKSIWMAGNHLRTCPFQWLHLRKIIKSQNKSYLLWYIHTFSREVETQSLRPKDYSLHGALLTFQLGNKQTYVKEKACWNELLCEFPVKIVYRPGQRNILADALSKRPDPELLGITVLQNPPLATKIRDMYPTDGCRCLGKTQQVFSCRFRRWITTQFRDLRHLLVLFWPQD